MLYETLKAHYKYVYDGQGNIVRSLDMLAQKEYTYSYEDGRITHAAEYDIALDGNEIVAAKTLVNTIFYVYDGEGSLTRKRILPAGGEERIIYYETADDNTTVKFRAGGKDVASHSKTDSFGRKVFDELQLGTGFVSRQFSYHAGNVTEEHTENEKLRSSPTTQLVSQIVLSDGRTLSYEYDAEERITKVTDSFEGVTEYTYDALGQLLTETVNGEVVNEMVYDNYGNILQKNGIRYTYSEGWNDRLAFYDGKQITYDAQGNPLAYLGHTLTWEKGRQLKSFDGIQFTYNANDIRTSKTVDGIRHDYLLDGVNILTETWDDNVLETLYDNEDSVCGIIYNGVPYYFHKNLQGDIIAIADQNGKVVARYTYDAWGKCEISVKSTNAAIAEINPYRYRGYYFDTETGLYYLQSRYYDPEVGRFINGDDQILCFVLGTNLFCYCENNATNKIDSEGTVARVAIDPGHGGKNNGAVASRLESTRVGRWGMPIHIIKSYYEKAFNLNVALVLKRLLTGFKYAVTMTRTKDNTVDLDTRYRIANKSKADIFVSIHHNSTNIFKKGYLVLYAGKHDKNKSKKLACCISSTLGKYTKLRRNKAPASDNKLAVLNGTKMPAVLVECGYMGGDLYYCRDHYSQIALAIAYGIMNYFS